MIKLNSVSKTFPNGQTVVHDLDLEIATGEFLILLGESGCGKTTTLKMVNRLVPFSSGSIEVLGNDIMDTAPTHLRRQIGYVFQGIGLFPHMTVADNIGTVPKLLGWPSKKTAARCDELLQLLNLPPETFRHRLPSELSGGQRQRVGLARALAAESKIMLMDEPFGAIDPINRAELQDEFRKLHENLGLTTVMVTHDMTEALMLADRIAVMSGGKVEQLDTPKQLFLQPGSEYVASLVKTPKHHANFLAQLQN